MTYADTSGVFTKDRHLSPEIPNPALLSKCVPGRHVHDAHKSPIQMCTEHDCSWWTHRICPHDPQLHSGSVWGGPSHRGPLNTSQIICTQGRGGAQISPTNHAEWVLKTQSIVTARLHSYETEKGVKVICSVWGPDSAPLWVWVMEKGGALGICQRREKKQQRGQWNRDAVV